MDNKQILLDSLKFHGHKCWASVAGVGFMMQKAKRRPSNKFMPLCFFSSPSN